MYNIKAIKHTESCPSWSKEHDWKSCNRQKRFVGSNPMLSAMKSAVSPLFIRACGFLLFMNCYCFSGVCIDRFGLF